MNMLAIAENESLSPDNTSPYVSGNPSPVQNFPSPNATLMMNGVGVPTHLVSYSASPGYGGATNGSSPSQSPRSNTTTVANTTASTNNNNTSNNNNNNNNSNNNNNNSNNNNNGNSNGGDFGAGSAAAVAAAAAAAYPSLFSHSPVNYYNPHYSYAVMHSPASVGAGGGGGGGGGVASASTGGHEQTLMTS